MRKIYWVVSACAMTSLWMSAALAAQPVGFQNVLRQMGLQTGRWHTTLRIVAVQVLPATPKDVVPPDVRTALEKKLGSSFETDDCIGTGLAANGDLVLPGIKVSSECSLSSAEAANHNLTLNAVCGNEADGFRADVNVRATYDDTVMAAKMETSVLSRKLGYITKLTLSTSSKYVGRCSS